MAKDYSSFRQALLDLIPIKIPQWLDTSEADTGMMLLGNFSHIHNELSYFQDRIANEAFLSTATQRTSVRGHLALIDYYLNDGQSASVYIKIKVLQSTTIPAGFQLSTNNVLDEDNLIIFETIVDQYVDPKHNEINLLDIGIDKITGEPFAILEKKFSKIKKGQYVLFENTANNIAEIVKLTKDASPDGTNTKITWSIEEKLKYYYNLKSDKICANIAKANHGKTVQREILKEKNHPASKFSFRLKNGPLTFVSEDSASPPSQSTLCIWVDGELWKQTSSSLLESGPFDKSYSFSIDNNGLATVTFGDGVFGLMPSDYSLIEAQYRFGNGSIGNVGKNTLTKFDFPFNSLSITSIIENIINPSPSFGGQDPDSIDEAKIAGPKSLKIQQRAVVMQDYERLVVSKFQNFISRAKAKFVYNGSLKSVIVYLESKNSIRLDSSLINQIKRYIDTIKMIGYYIQVEPANYVPIEIAINVYIIKDFDSSGIRDQIRMNFSNKINPDGSKGFFHPDNFGFGDFVYVSKIYETLKKTPEVKYGVVYIFRKSTLISIKNSYTFTQVSQLPAKQDDETEGNLEQGYIPIDKHEIIKLENDPLHLNNGILILNFVEDKSEGDLVESSIEDGEID